MLYQISTYRTKGVLDHAILGNFLEACFQAKFYIQEELHPEKQDDNLDILFCNVDGIQKEEKKFLCSYIKNHPKVKTVIISEEKKFMEDAFHLHVYDYLFSPVLMQDICKILDDFLYEKFYISKITLQLKGKLLRLNIQDIQYVECIKKVSKIRIHANEDYIIAMRMKDLYEMLKDYGFYMPHRSYIINVKYIKEVYYDYIIMRNMYRIPISQLKIKELRELVGKSII